jgi:membrane protein YdbS with pleckstrin-like domain
MRLVPNTDTVPTAVNRYLLPHERQVITVHFHPAVLIGPVGVVVAGLVGAAVASSISAFSSNALLVIWLVWGLLVLYSIGKVLRWSVDYFVVTSERLILVKGLLARDVVSVPNAKVDNMRFRRSTMGRVLGYGQFIIEAARDQPIHMVNFMPYPEQLYLEVCGLVYREPGVSQDPGAAPDPGLPQPLYVPVADPHGGLPGQPEPRGSWRREQPGGEVYPEHDDWDEDKERGP